MNIFTLNWIKKVSVSPFYAFTVLPDTLALRANIVFVKTFARLLAENPTAIVFAPVFPYESTLSMALIILERANILLTIGPNKVSMAVHLVIYPISVEVLPVGPSVLATSLDFVHTKFTFIHWSIRESQLAKTVLLSFEVIALVEGIIGPSLSSKSILFVVFPSSYVTSTVGMNVSALPICLIVDPVALIDVPISMV
jgi:hypothetical protein